MPSTCRSSAGALTGWRVEPVPALIGFGRVLRHAGPTGPLPAASFIRKRKHFRLSYNEEPGHLPRDIFSPRPPLLDRIRLRAFSQVRPIGAGTRCDKADYAWLIRLYWFSIEFGLMREDGQLKALGSGLASSVTELPWAISGQAEQRPFDVIDILRTPYRIDIHQPVYFVIDDLDDLFAAARRDLLADIAQARALGLHAPKYPPKTAA